MQKKVRVTTNFKLKSELDELKKKRNKDIEEVRILKIEFQKLEKVWHQYKIVLPSE